MDRMFRWNMFITSFIPLWLTILISNIWDIARYGIEKWKCEQTWRGNFRSIIHNNLVSVIVICVIFVLMFSGIFFINKFLKDKCSNPALPKITINRAARANKLSSEFLLAYILPMIAFNFSELRSVVLFGIYFGMLAFLCIRNNNVYTNIWLEIRGYRMYMCELEGIKMNRIHIYKDCLVISKNDLTTQTGNEIEHWDFDNYIYIDLK